MLESRKADWLSLLPYANFRVIPEIFRFPHHYIINPDDLPVRLNLRLGLFRVLYFNFMNLIALFEIFNRFCVRLFRFGRQVFG